MSRRILGVVLGLTGLVHALAQGRVVLEGAVPSRVLEANRTAKGLAGAGVSVPAGLSACAKKVGRTVPGKPILIRNARTGSAGTPHPTWFHWRQRVWQALVFLFPPD
jgi:hypothetical protein